MIPFARAKGAAASILGASILAAALTFALPASAKNAKCSVHSADGNFNGPCTFAVQRGGSFTIRALDRRTILPRVGAVTVDVTGDGTGEAKAVMVSGVSSPWGEVHRSPGDRSCWVGDDFWICAY